jgi:hypothetical protein
VTKVNLDQRAKKEIKAIPERKARREILGLGVSPAPLDQRDRRVPQGRRDHREFLARTNET